ncbi:MAG: sugar phosphate nucleotidyltransferase [Bryobacteraceae bacterium]|nr:sugar phosphate nucleotidyltransferase [Bryobacteraceae bacterium]MDW8378509.1 sugar phosphate nucleotidyltransferase [Bryobacterales bacterium]
MAIQVVASPTVILLAGGFGTRVRELYPDLPKPMIPVLGEPFLEWEFRYWAAQGFHRFIVSLGYLAHVAESYCASRRSSELTIETVVEPTPLGTGGALHYAASCKGVSEPFVAANADSLLLTSIQPAADAMCDPAVDGVLFGIPVEDASRYGSLEVEGQLLMGFREKSPGRGIINAGVYVLRPRLLERFPASGPLSLESEVFPFWLASGAKFLVIETEAPFLDIGTPASFRQAEEFLGKHFPSGTIFR